MHAITRKFHLEAAHRLQDHGGKCRNLHGHSYVFSVTIGHKCGISGGHDLGDGMVIDFDELDDLIGKRLMEECDHAVILDDDDPMASHMEAYLDEDRGEGRQGVKVARLHEGAPTAENLARFFFRMCRALLMKHSVDVLSTSVRETADCEATYAP